MPKEIFGREFAFLPRDQLLTFEEITRLARAFSREGVLRFIEYMDVGSTNGWRMNRPRSYRQFDLDAVGSSS